MLRGVCPERLAALQDQGLNTRVYIPCWREKFLYLLNRLAEHPLSLFDAIAAAATSDLAGYEGGV